MTSHIQSHLHKFMRITILLILYIEELHKQTQFRTLTCKPEVHHNSTTDITSTARCMTAVSPVHMHWRYHSLTPSHQHKISLWLNQNNIVFWRNNDVIPLKVLSNSSLRSLLTFPRGSQVAVGTWRGLIWWGRGTDYAPRWPLWKGQKDAVVWKGPQNVFVYMC